MQIHFRQTDSTRALGNVGQFQVGGIDLSFRQRNEYVLAEGSTHKNGVDVYKRVVDASIIPMPDKMVEYIRHLQTRVQKVAKDSGATDDAPRNERGLIAHGNIHPWLVSQAGKLRNQRLTADEIEEILLRRAHEECEEPLDDNKIRQVARSVGQYPPGENKDLILTGSTAPGAAAEQTLERTSQESDKFHFTDVNLKPKAGSTLLVFESEADADLASRLGFNSTAVLPGEGSTSVSATVTSIKLAYERLVLFGDSEAIKTLKPMVTPGSILGEFPFREKSLDDAAFANDDDALRDHLNKQLKHCSVPP